jgi:hypothetical protein
MFRIGFEPYPRSGDHWQVAVDRAEKALQLIRMQERGCTAAQIEGIEGLSRRLVDKGGPELPGAKLDLLDQPVDKLSTPITIAREDIEVAVGADPGAKREVKVEAWLGR